MEVRNSNQRRDRAGHDARDEFLDYTGWQIGVAWEAQPGPLIEFVNLLYYGELEYINTGTRTFNRSFNTNGFERNAARAPAAFHRRVFPTRVSGLCGDPHQLLEQQRAARISS